MKSDARQQEPVGAVPDSQPCPICREPIRLGANKCIHCNEYIVQGWRGRLGFSRRTLWDVLGLLIVPLTLALLVFWLGETQERRQLAVEESRITAQNELEQIRIDAQSTTEAGRIEAQSTIEAGRTRADILQTYLDEMSAIVLQQDLTEATVLSAIRARTIATANALDGKHNATVLIYLYELGLLERLDLRYLNLGGANLYEVDLQGANLETFSLEGAYMAGANLRGVNLSNAYLPGVNLFGADLSGADLSKNQLWWANLSEANLSGADLSGADLFGTDFSRADLRGANLSGAILGGRDFTPPQLTEAVYDNTTIWPEGFDPTAAGAINRDSTVSP